MYIVVAIRRVGRWEHVAPGDFITDQGRITYTLITLRIPTTTVEKNLKETRTYDYDYDCI